MKLFIFEEVEKLTVNYHPEGALIVIAEDLQAAINLANHTTLKDDWRKEGKTIQLSEKEVEKVITYELLGDVESGLYVFPNSGCC